VEAQWTDDEFRTLHNDLTGKSIVSEADGKAHAAKPVQKEINAKFGVRAACRRSHKHRLAGVLQAPINKSYTKTDPQVIGKPMTMRAAASRTHSKPGKSILKEKLLSQHTVILTKFKRAFTDNFL
jgi:hypothetical protein